jgi:DNA modification methylase
MKVIAQEFGPNWVAYHGDCVEVVKGIPDNTIHYSLFSPPFASLFTYSDSERDMGNCKGEEDFSEHFAYLIPQLFRVIMPGRLISLHCMDLPASITHDGFMGVKDFPGHLIAAFEKHGFIYHSRVCIWKDPLVQATRTKKLQLAHKQICKDSTLCANGFPDYIVTMRKPGKNPEPVAHGRGFERYIGDLPNPADPKNNIGRLNKYSHKVWQRYASPVWFDINQTRTLNVSGARDDKDERHICPLQLDTIARCLELWTNPGDTVLSPFMGIGSEGYESIKMERNFMGIELKESYFRQAVKNLQSVDNAQDQLSLFA